MAQLKFIKSLKNPNVTLLQLLNSYIFGDAEIRPYNPERVYNRGDLILSIDETTGNFEILQCVFDDITGPFQFGTWTKNIVQDFIGGNKVNTKMVIVSEIQPVHPSNLIWYQTIANKQSIDTDKLDANVIIVFSGNEFAAQDNAPPADGTEKVWFDYEFGS